MRCGDSDGVDVREGKRGAVIEHGPVFGGNCLSFAARHHAFSHDKGINYYSS